MQVSIASTASTTSMALMTFTTSVHEKNNARDGWILPGSQTTQIVPFLWNGSIKNPNFHWYLLPFCRRLLRSANITFLKTGYIETKISKPKDFRTAFKQITVYIFLSVRPISLITLHFIKLNHLFLCHHPNKKYYD